jgi:hypothetical protein
VEALNRQASAEFCGRESTASGDSRRTVQALQVHGYEAIGLSAGQDSIYLWKGLSYFKEQLNAEHIPAVKMKRGRFEVTDEGMVRSPAGTNEFGRRSK